MFLYRGVFAPEPPARVSPNGDGVDDTPNLAYRLAAARPLNRDPRAPDGSTHHLAQTALQVAPGMYRGRIPGRDAAAPPRNGNGEHAAVPRCVGNS